MRLFQIKIDSVDTMDWIVGKEEYEKQYGERREKALVEAAAQDTLLLEFGVVEVKNHPTVVNEKQLIDLTVNAIKFEMVREIPTGEEGDLNGVMRKFNRMAAKLMSLPGLHRDDSKHDCQNERVHVHMPGQALSTYNRVQLLENACSDELQRSLDEGWRMIAACPQPDARRPDYILGRYEPDRNPIDSRDHYAVRSQ